jgi:hypothetical protein
MTNLHIQSGQNLRLPVPETHPLAVHQSFRMPTRQEVSGHPFWSQVVARRTAQLPAEQSEIAIGSIARNIGWIVGYQLEDILVDPGGTLTFFGIWNEVTAGTVTVSAATGNLPSGTIRVYYSDPTISPTFVLNCTTLTGGGY